MIEDTIEKMINERAVSYVKDMAEQEERARGCEVDGVRCVQEMTSYIKGAKDLLEDHWIPVTKELPYMSTSLLDTQYPNVTKTVLCCDRYGNVSTDIMVNYDNDGKWNWQCDDQVDWDYWCPIWLPKQDLRKGTTDWIKIEDGCEMPAKGEFVNVCLADGRYTNSFIMSDGTWAFNIKPTKWKCVEKGKNNNESE
jgi:hypothetical protein